MTTTTATTTRARRGDLAVIVTPRHDAYAHQLDVHRTEVEIAEVTNITRDGTVKAVRTVWPDTVTPMTRWHGPPTVYLVPRNRIDVPAALATARTHTWPGHPGQPRPYDGLDEARTALRPHLRTTTTGEA